MKKIKYLEIIKTAFNLTLKNKFLLILGFFVLIGIFSFFLNEPLGTTFLFNDAKNNIQFNLNRLKFSGIIFGVFLITLILQVIRILGTSGLIKAINSIVIYRQNSILSILSEIKKYNLRLLLLDFLSFTFIFILSLILFAPIAYLLSVNNLIYASLSLGLAFLIIMPISILIFFVRKFAYLYIVLGELNVKDAIEGSYNLFENNFKESLIMSLFIIMLNFLAIVLCLLIWGIIFVVSSPFILVVYLSFGSASAIILGALFTILAAIIILLILAALEVIVQAAWVLFFKEISFNKTEENKKEEKAEGIIPNPEAA